MVPIYNDDEEEEEEEECLRIQIDPPQIDPLKIADSLKNKLVENPPLTARCCIYKVPRKLRKNKESLFRPSLVSIGPYHWKSKHLQPMEDIKMWYLKCLLARKPTADNDEKLLERLVKSVGDQLNFCRECYAEKQKLPKNDNEFVEMMVVDGCFIIEYFRKQQNVVPKSEDDPIFEMSWMRKILVVDFLLLENQIPWVVLHLLYNLTQVTVAESQRKYLSLPQLSHDSMHFHTLREKSIPNLQSSKLEPIRHLLDLHRTIMLYSDQNEPVSLAGAMKKSKKKKVKELILNASLESGQKKFQLPSYSPRDHLKKGTILKPSRPQEDQTSVVNVSSDGNKGKAIPPPPPPPPPPMKPMPMAINPKPKPKRNQKKKKPAPLSPTSLLDLDRIENRRKRSCTEANKRFVYTPCLKVLLQAGVTFQVQEGNDLMKIEFENGVLKIPKVNFMDNAEILLRNLIAYEQCDRDLEDKITSYAGFLDNLIDSSRDLEKLRDANIISFHLSSEDVSDFFKGLYNNVHVVHYTYWHVSEDIHEYCKYTIPKWRVILKRDYFSNPWSGISVVAGIIMLALNFLQTYYTVMDS